MALYENGALERHGVELIGANYEAIRTAEDRQLFKEKMKSIGVDVTQSRKCLPPHSAQILPTPCARNALIPFCVLVFVMTAGPMLYTVNNFGTLFRLRLTVYCVAAIFPITLREEGP